VIYFIHIQLGTSHEEIDWLIDWLIDNSDTNTNISPPSKWSDSHDSLTRVVHTRLNTASRVAFISHLTVTTHNNASPEVATRVLIIAHVGRLLWYDQRWMVGIDNMSGSGQGSRYITCVPKFNNGNERKVAFKGDTKLYLTASFSLPRYATHIFPPLYFCASDFDRNESFKTILRKFQLTTARHLHWRISNVAPW
jgi:hypothetical protein